MLAVTTAKVAAMASHEELLGWRLALLTAAKAMVTATAVASLERSLLLLLRSHC